MITVHYTVQYSTALYRCSRAPRLCVAPRNSQLGPDPGYSDRCRSQPSDAGISEYNLTFCSFPPTSVWLIKIENKKSIHSSIFIVSASIYYDHVRSLRARNIVLNKTMFLPLHYRKLSGRPDIFSSRRMYIFNIFFVLPSV